MVGDSNVVVDSRVIRANVFVGPCRVRFVRGDVPGDVRVSVLVGDEAYSCGLTMLQAVELVDAITVLIDE